MRIVPLLALAAASPALAEVEASSPTGFEVERKAIVAASPAEIYAEIGRIGEWWDPVHSYSGKSVNLRLELKAGGCFCEQLANGGSVKHMEVIYADPQNGVRLSGALGPLQSEAVAGTLGWSFRPVPGGTELLQYYRVSGAIRGGAQAVAPAVDQVVGAQFDRLVARLKK